MPMKWIYIITLSILFSGCNLEELLESPEDKAKKNASEKIAFNERVKDSKEIQLQQLSAQTQKDLAILASKKELALIEKEKELEKIRMQSELEKQRIIFEQEKAKALFEQTMLQNEQMDNMELKRYVFVILALLMLMSGFFTYYYFKKRREDKLRAYNDNLQKYFNQKENDARVKIAEKMLDTIASGKLDKSQENQLIGAFSGEANGEYQKQLTSNSTSQDVEIIEISPNN